MKSEVSFVKKRILSIIISLCIILGAVPFTAYAANTVSFSAIDGTGGTGSEGYDKLFDGKKTSNNFSKWCIQLPADGAYVVFKASERVSVTGYTFTTGNDNATVNGRNPKNWVLYACNDYDEENKTDGTWTEIHKVENDTVLKDVNYTDYSFAVSGAGYYKYYKLFVSATKSNELLQLAEMTLQYTACEHSYEETTVSEATCTEAKLIKKVCSVCGDTVETESGKALGHTWGADDVCTGCGMKRTVIVSGGTEGVDYRFEYNSEGVQTELIILTTKMLRIKGGSDGKIGLEKINTMSVNGNARLILADDVTVDSQISLRGDMELYLQSHNITFTNNGSFRLVIGDFMLTDSKTSPGTVYWCNKAVEVESDGDFTLEKVTLLYNGDEETEAVGVYVLGEFYMNSGTVKAESDNATAVYIDAYSQSFTGTMYADGGTVEGKVYVAAKTTGRVYTGVISISDTSAEAMRNATRFYGEVNNHGSIYAGSYYGDFAIGFSLGVGVVGGTFYGKEAANYIKRNNAVRFYIGDSLYAVELVKENSAWKPDSPEKHTVWYADSDFTNRVEFPYAVEENIALYGKSFEIVGKCEKENAAAKFTSEGEEFYIDTIENAFINANNIGKATVTLLKDTSVSDSAIKITNEVTLDINGNSLQREDGTLFSVEKGGVLTLSDTKENSTATVKAAKGNNSDAIYVAEGGKFVLKSGIIERCGEESFGPELKPIKIYYNYGGISVEKDGVLEILGGEIRRPKDSEQRETIYLSSGATLISGGGTVKSDVYVSKGASVVPSSTSENETGFYCNVTNYGTVSGGSFNPPEKDSDSSGAISIIQGYFYNYGTFSGGKIQTGLCLNNATYGVVSGGEINSVTENVYKVTFKSKDGTATIKSQYRANAPATDPYEHTDTEILCFYADEGCTTEYDFTKNITKNTVIYTKHEEYKYTVRFYVDGVDGTYYTQSFYYGEEQTLKEIPVGKTDYRFKCWNTKPDGSGKSYSNGETVKMLTSECGGVVSLFAVWEENFALVDITVCSYGIKRTYPAEVKLVRTRSDGTKDEPIIKTGTTYTSFRFENLKSGKYTVTVSAEGHTPREYSLNVNEGDGIDAPFDISLSFDVNGDGVVDVLDVVEIERALNNHTRFFGYTLSLADADGDGEITATDYSAAVNAALAF